MDGNYSSHPFSAAYLEWGKDASRSSAQALQCVLGLTQGLIQWKVPKRYADHMSKPPHLRPFDTKVLSSCSCQKKPVEVVWARD